MESYIVGGAVRDYVLGRTAHDVDHLLVNATPADIQGMLDAGAKRVGKAFPVYILNGEQYALACKNRSEFSTQNTDNYRGVTLEDDLSCRDFTMNAMALDENHHLIDPYHGVDDIMKKRIRANSPRCFLDDPVRILRAARQAAELSFDFEDDTAYLMHEAVQSGLLNDCSPDRIWGETEKAIRSDHPSRYFELLDSVGALSVVFPELSVLRAIPQPAEHHPEIWTLLHTYMVLDRSVELGCGQSARFAALFHDLGKGTTEENRYPKHIGHELRGLDVLNRLRERYPIPTDVYELSACVAVNHLRVHTVMQIKKPSKLVNLVRDIGGFRQDGGQFFGDVLTVCQSDAQGRKDKKRDPYPQAKFLMGARNAILSVKQSDEYKLLVDSETYGVEFAKSLNLMEIKAAQNFMKNQPKKMEDIMGHQKEALMENLLNHYLEGANSGEVLVHYEDAVKGMQAAFDEGVQYAKNEAAMEASIAHSMTPAYLAIGAMSLLDSLNSDRRSSLNLSFGANADILTRVMDYAPFVDRFRNDKKSLLPNTSSFHESVAQSFAYNLLSSMAFGPRLPDSQLIEDEDYDGYPEPETIMKAVLQDLLTEDDFKNIFEESDCQETTRSPMYNF